MLDLLGRKDWSVEGNEAAEEEAFDEGPGGERYIDINDA